MSINTYSTINQTDKGRKWVAVNSTIGTGVATNSLTAFDNTKATFVLFNNAASPPGRIIYPEYVRLLVTTAPAGTAVHYAVTLDTAARGVTSTTGCTVANTDSDAIGTAGNLPTAASIAFAQFGAISLSAATTKVVNVAQGIFKAKVATPAAVVNDVYVLNFAQEETGVGNLNNAAEPIRVQTATGLVSVGPGGLFAFHTWVVGSAGAASYELEAGWWELS